MSVKKKSLNIAITSGDPDGIGLEVSVKGLLNSTLPKTNCFLFTSDQQSSFNRRLLAQLAKKRAVTVTNDDDWKDLLARPPRSNSIVVIKSQKSPPQWVEESAKFCMAGHFQALVTAPLSKTLIRESGFKEVGHTEILKRVSGSGQLNMGFLGRHFNVVLATGHLPINRVASALSLEVLANTVQNAKQLQRLLSPAKQKLPLALLGLNPHAGDSGLIGAEELQILQPFVKNFSRRELVGPLVPDAAFRPEYFKAYSAFICLYHDQGLIPFKAFHGYDSAHITLGIPFVRTSVDHGTAKDIFGKNKADWRSMEQALTWATKMARSPRRT